MMTNLPQITNIFDYSSTKLNFIKLVAVVLLSIGLGILTALPTVAVASLAIILGLGAVITLLFLARLSNKLYFTLVILICSTTVARETIGLPFETDLFAVFVIIFSLGFSRAEGSSRSIRLPLLIPVIGYVTIIFLGAYLNSRVPEISFRQCIILTYRFITFYAVINVVQRVSQFRMNYIVHFQHMMLLSVGLGLISLALYPYLKTPFLFYLHTVPSIQGLFQEANLLGIYILCTLSITVAFYLFNPYERSRQNILIILLGLIGIVLSNTRSTWIGIILALAILRLSIGVKAGKTANRTINVVTYVTALVATVTALIIYTSPTTFSSNGYIDNLTQRILSIFNPYDNDSSRSAVGRLETWDIVINLWQKHMWIGAGLLSFEDTASAFKGWIYNFVLQLLYDSGALGIFFMTWLYVGCLYYCFKGYMIATDNRDKGILLGYFTAQICLYFTSLFSNFTWSSFAFVLQGLAVGHSLIVIQAKTKQGRSYRTT